MSVESDEAETRCINAGAADTPQLAVDLAGQRMMLTLEN